MAYEQSHANSLGYDISNDPTPIYDIQSSAYYDSKVVDQQSNVQPSKILSNVGMMSPQQAPANSHFRKDSFVNNAGVLSPAESASNWDAKPYTAGFDHAHQAPTTNAYQQDNNPYARQDPAPFFGQNPYIPWNFEHSGTNTPTGHEAFAPTKYETSPYPQQAPEMQHRLSTISEHQGDPTYVPAPQVHTPQSPQSHAEWLAFHGEMDGRQTMPKRIRPNSSPRLDILERKGDGIRKKNARIEIPSDRNLESIERLLVETTNEEERKELKGQKRLLRNREAALASRQRKKRHTEDLEIKEKNLQHHLQTIEHQLAESQIQLELQEKDRQHLLHQLRDATVTIDGLRHEKETLIINYTQETGNLRQKINYLTEQLEAGPAPAMSAAPSSTGFTDFNSELDNLHLDGHTWGTEDLGWDVLASTGTFTMEPSKPMPVAQPEPTKQHNDPPIASGILFMLLLCGAFVTSRSSSGASAIPHMPEDVKAASSTVLNSLLKNAGSDVFTDFASNSNARSSQNSQATLHPLAEPTQSSTSWPGTSHLSNLHRQLTSPSKAQEAEQIFSLTPAEYNSLTGQSSASNYAQHPVVPIPTGNRRRLGEMLQNLREESIVKGGAAEVYTRSLLWDQVPEDVVREFKKRVKESEKSPNAGAPSPGSHPKPSANFHDGMFAYALDS